MSDWIEKEFENEKNRKEEQERKQQIIDYANYWAKLKEQIRMDVEQINKLWNAQVKITDDDNFKIERTKSLPAVYITVSNGGKAIDVKTEIVKDVEVGGSPTEQQLSVFIKNNRVYLKAGFRELLIPEQASEYILRPLLDAVQNS